MNACLRLTITVIVVCSMATALLLAGCASSSTSGGTGGGGGGTTPTPTPTAPAAPTGLAATAGSAQVSLTWTGSSGATSYSVKRGTSSGGPYTQVATPTTTTYVDSGLTSGTTYYYVVAAVNSAGASANSSQASATPTAGQTVPAVPTGLTATAGNAQVSLSWNASTGATSYGVKRGTTSGGPYTQVATPITTTYVDSGLTSGTTYYYVVAAVNSAGASANSSQASATPTAGQTAEYNNGGGQHIAGTLAEADNLGIFGSQGVFAASYWPLSPNEPYPLAAFRMYRGFNGSSASFGDVSLQSTSSDVQDVVVYASLDSTTPGRVVFVAINRSTTTKVTAISGQALSGTAHLYQITATSAQNQSPVQPVAAGQMAVSGSSMTVSLPALSVTTIEVQ